MNKLLLKLRDKKGIILPLALTYVLIFTAEIAGLTQYASNTHRLIVSEQNHLQAFYLAEAATEKAVAAVRLYVATNGASPSSGALSTLGAAPTVTSSGVSYSSSSVAFANGGGWTSKVLSEGDYAGLSGNVQTVNISFTATDTKNGVTHTATVSQALELQLIPIFQFGVFYQNDLEILPGANMTFSGAVHTNGNMYVGNDNAGNSTSFQSTITSAGTIIHGRKDGGTIASGGVRVEDSAGAYQDMYSGGSWLDSNDSNWQNGAIDRWDGNVKSAAHGVKTLTLPISTGSQPHQIIERRVSGENATLQAQKMDYKANLRIIDGSVMAQNGSAIELRYCSGGGTFNGTSCPGGQSIVNPVSSTQYYNFREAKTMKSTDINVGLLKNSPAFQSLVSANNGVVIYVSDRRSSGSATYEDVVRLTNGASLPTKGMTLAAENPVYIKGDYNTTSKQPSGIVSDAFNVLSNAWSDSNSTNTNLTNKNASATTINTALITGNKNTTSGNYNGGFENLMRFHENWSGITMTYAGSVANLYTSTIATGNWVYGGNYYTAPTRSWSYDSSFSNPSYSIPGFPSVYSVVKSGYEAN